MREREQKARRDAAFPLDPVADEDRALMPYRAPNNILVRAGRAFAVDRVDVERWLAGVRQPVVDERAAQGSEILRPRLPVSSRPDWRCIPAMPVSGA